MSSIGPRAGGLRAIRIWLLAAIVLIGFNTATTVLLWRSNDARVRQINDERARNIVRSCRDTNDRHDATIRQLTLLVNAIPDGPRKTRARQSMQGTVALIEALVPRRDCSALVREQVDTQ